MPFGINTAPEEYQRRQIEHISYVPGVAMIADDPLVFGCGNTMEQACKYHDSNLRGIPERAEKIEMRLNSAKIRLQHEDIIKCNNILDEIRVIAC